MRIYTRDAHAGVSIMVCGETGVGKSYSLNTVKGNLLVLNQEPKNILATVKKKDMLVIGMDSFDEIMQFVSLLIEHTKDSGKCIINKEFVDKVEKEMGSVPFDIDDDNPFKVDVVCFDSITAYMRMLREKLEDSISMDTSERVLKSFKRELRPHERFKSEWDLWGALASMMHRTTNLLTSLADYGVDVIVIARGFSDISGMNIVLDGKEFPKHVAAYFNGIGLVMPGVDKPYPPKIVFAPSGDFCGKPPCVGLESSKGWPLDWSKILEAVHNEAKEDK